MIFKKFKARYFYFGASRAKACQRSSHILFGGESIRGFMFALIVGVLVGTYSSVFVATPIMFDTLKKKFTS